MFDWAIGIKFAGGKFGHHAKSVISLPAVYNQKKTFKIEMMLKVFFVQLRNYVMAIDEK